MFFYAMLIFTQKVQDKINTNTNAKNNKYIKVTVHSFISSTIKFKKIPFFTILLSVIILKSVRYFKRNEENCEYI